MQSSLFEEQHFIRETIKKTINCSFSAVLLRTHPPYHRVASSLLLYKFIDFNSFHFCIDQIVNVLLNNLVSFVKTDKMVRSSLRMQNASDAKRSRCSKTRITSSMLSISLICNIHFCNSSHNNKPSPAIEDGES